MIRIFLYVLISLFAAVEILSLESEKHSKASVALA
jgi:hypothetical protein